MKERGLRSIPLIWCTSRPSSHRGGVKSFVGPQDRSDDGGRKFYANAFESPVSISIVQERQVKYDAITINALLKIQNAPHGPHQVAQLGNTIDLDEVSQVLCDNVVNWTMVRGIQTTIFTKELRSNMNIWHHFISA